LGPSPYLSRKLGQAKASSTHDTDGRKSKREERETNHTHRGEEGVLDLSNTTEKKTANLFIYSLDGIRQRGFNSTRGPRSLTLLPFCAKRYIIAPKACQIS
jgi:hypothetical protein